MTTITKFSQASVWLQVPTHPGPWKPTHLAVLFDRLMAALPLIAEMRVQPRRIDVLIALPADDITMSESMDRIVAKIKDAVDGTQAAAAEAEELVRARRPS